MSIKIIISKSTKKATVFSINQYIILIFITSSTKIIKTMSKITVSDQFVDIYQNLTKENQVENINKLSKEELYLLLIYAIDNLDEENPILIENMKTFENEGMEIFDIQDDNGTSNPVLLKLIKASGSKYIIFDEVVDKSGNKVKL